eukprot:354292-Chlamydomonas_euryale.AAC.1
MPGTGHPPATCGPVRQRTCGSACVRLCAPPTHASRTALHRASHPLRTQARAWSRQVGAAARALQGMGEGSVEGRHAMSVVDALDGGAGRRGPVPGCMRGHVLESQN